MWGLQSDDVVESTTSRPLQTVGTNWEPDPWPRLELALVAALLKRLVGARWLTTFFCGWKRMMCSLGAKRQPSTTEPLRLTDTHMVVVCTSVLGERAFAGALVSIFLLL